MKNRILIIFTLILPSILFLTGCSGGVNGEGGNTYAQQNGTPVIRGNRFNDQGWDLMGKGQYESAIAKFNQVLTDNPTDQEKIEAYNGLGWARSNLGTLHDGVPYFEKAMEGSDDAKVGLAAAYVQQNSKADLEKAVDLLYKGIGKENPHFHYVPRRKTGVSDAELHAMLAYAFAGIGKRDEAILQMDYAKELNPAWATTTIDQIDKMVEFLNR